MTDDSELESLQCYPFHLPEPEPFVLRPRTESASVALLQVTQEGEPIVDTRAIEAFSGIPIKHVRECFPAQLGPAPDSIKSPSYQPYRFEGDSGRVQDCDYLGYEAGQPCWGQTEVDIHVTVLGSVAFLYRCQGHKRGRGKYDFENERW